MSISAADLLAKVKDWSETKAGKERMNGAISSAQSGNGKLASGKTVLTEAKVQEISDGLVTIIVKHLPESITAAPRSVLEDLYVSAPLLEDGKYTVKVKFSNLHRQSLINDQPGAKTYDGIDNIIALLNNGYEAKHIVSGWWVGHESLNEDTAQRQWEGLGVQDAAWIKSRRKLEGLHFLDDIKREFYATYGQQYNVELIFGDDYDVT
jgi:hypothetical protein